MKNVFNLMVGLGLSLAVIACSQDDDTTPATLGFTTTTATGAEDAGKQTITISLSKAVTTDTEITFALGGTASLNGDYTLGTTLPVTIAAGTISTTIDFTIIDESILEPSNETVVFTITQASGLTLTGTENLTHTYTIADNDETPAEGMQVDLTWDLGTGADIDQADLDLYLAYNVTIEDDAIGSFDINEDVVSAHDTGFESFIIPADLKDNEYYVVVQYFEGTVAVPYLLGFSESSLGYNESDGDFGAGDEDYAYFFGPIVKNGSSYGRQASPLSKRYKVRASAINSRKQ